MQLRVGQQSPLARVGVVVVDRGQRSPYLFMNLLLFMNS